MCARIPTLAVVVMLLPTLSIAQTCPQNQINGISSSLPRDHQSGSSFGQYGYGTWDARYDVFAASLQASATASGEWGTGASAVIEDDFTLIGLPAGTPVAITAHFNVNLIGGSYDGYHGSWGTAHLSDAFGHTVMAEVPPGDSPQDLVLPVPAVAGQPFRLQFEVGASCFSSGGSADGVFSFTGVPTGAAIVSCQGYVSDTSVPVRATSWGRLKSLYR